MPPSLPIYTNASSSAAPRAYTVPLERGAVVDLLLVNPSLMAHPMHVHGHAAYVLATGTGSVTKADGSADWEALRGKLNLDDPPLLDTVTVPQGRHTMGAGSGMDGMMGGGDSSGMDGMGGGSGMGGMMDGGGGPHAGHGRRLRAAAHAHMAADPANQGFAVLRFVADNPGTWARARRGSRGA